MEYLHNREVWCMTSPCADKQLIGGNKLDADCCSPQNVDDQACENTSCLAHCETMSQGESKDGDDWTSGLASTTKDALNCRATRFQGYARSALERLNLPILSDHDIRSVWEAVAPYEVFHSLETYDRQYHFPRIYCYRTNDSRCEEISLNPIVSY